MNQLASGPVLGSVVLLLGFFPDIVNGDGMPPDCTGKAGDPGCISLTELDLIERWAAQCFPP